MRSCNGYIWGHILILQPCMYNFICCSVMVLSILGPYGASICRKEALYATKVIHYGLELILEMVCVQGEHIIFSFLLQPFIIGIMVHLEVLMVCLILCFDCWGFWSHVTSIEVGDGHWCFYYVFFMENVFQFHMCI